MERSLIKEYEHFHAADIYGFGGRHFSFILPHILALKPTSLIDYGAGRSNIAQNISEKAGINEIVSFDPAVPVRAIRPQKVFDLLISLDMLEHVPEEEMDGVLSEMASMANDFLHVIDTRPAKAILSDGRNAHVSQHAEDWWHARLKRFMPTVRPVPIRHTGRVAFKSWDEELPAFSHQLIESREAILMWAIRRFSLSARRQRRERRRRKAAAVHSDR
jgi:hypothetical protein